MRLKYIMLKETYFKLLNNYTDNIELQNELWEDIERNYSHRKRHYHTLIHLENLLKQLHQIKAAIEDWETILFTLYYHDIVYSALKANNEEESALLAEKRMLQISVPKECIIKCKSQILATKSHVSSTDNDTNYFTDADLSILGQNWEDYLLYAQNVRKEYAIYPDLIYKPGRKKVLLHFLSMKNIFKTTFFYSKFEVQARNNLKRELTAL